MDSVLDPPLCDVQTADPDLPFFDMARAEPHQLELYLWRLKAYIKLLEAATGDGHSLMTVISAPGASFEGACDFFNHEIEQLNHDSVETIKERILRTESSQVARYTDSRQNGVVAYAGHSSSGKVFFIIFEPSIPVPLDATCTVRGTRFRTDILKHFLESEGRCGALIIDSSQALFYLLSNHTTSLLRTLSLNHPMPRLLRYASGNPNTRHQVRREFYQEAIQVISTLFVDSVTGQPNINALILAGDANFQTLTSNTTLFPLPLRENLLIARTIEAANNEGLAQAAAAFEHQLPNLKLVREMNLLRRFCAGIAERQPNMRRCIYGIEVTRKAIQSNLVDTLILWEGLDVCKFQLLNLVPEEIKTMFLDKHQRNDPKNFEDQNNLELWSKVPAIEHFKNIPYHYFGRVEQLYNVQIVSDISSQGKFFAKNCGIGGILREPVHKTKLGYDDDDSPQED